MLLRKLGADEVYLIFIDEKFVGWLRYGMFWDELPFMNMLFIIEAYRGRELGKRLVQKWEEDMCDNGYKMVMTSTLSNEGAQHFYRKLGYRDIGGFIMPNKPEELMFLKELVG